MPIKVSALNDLVPNVTDVQFSAEFLPANLSKIASEDGLAEREETRY